LTLREEFLPAQGRLAARRKDARSVSLGLWTFFYQLPDCRAIAKAVQWQQV
jgi:hypothetical protein